LLRDHRPRAARYRRGKRTRPLGQHAGPCSSFALDLARRRWPRGMETSGQLWAGAQRASQLAPAPRPPGRPGGAAQDDRRWIRPPPLLPSPEEIGEGGGRPCRGEGVGETTVVWEHVEEMREKGIDSPRMHTRRSQTAKCRSDCRYRWRGYRDISFFILSMQIHMRLLLEMVLDKYSYRLSVGVGSKC
jgi:hypothetical protein